MNTLVTHAILSPQTNTFIVNNEPTEFADSVDEFYQMNIADFVHQFNEDTTN